MPKIFKFLILILIAINLIFCAWYVLHNDLYFYTDIARDFLLLQEIDIKKFVLLGPRSSTGGLFHGPLWLYLNYPAYVIGHGNPIVVGWFWIVLISLFLITSFFIAKKLFNDTTAYLFVLSLSVFLIFEARGLYNPHGAFFLLPAFFFFFIQCLQKLSLRSLLVFLLIAGCIIQFQMAIGIPLLMLATIPLVYQIVKQQKLQFLFAFLVLLIPLSTFILFDLKHHFIQLHSVFSYVFGNNLDKKTYGSIFGVVTNRLQLLLNGGIGVFKDTTNWSTNFIAALLMIGLITRQIKDGEHKIIYLSFIYFFLGYYLLSIVNKSGGMLYHYYMPLYPLVFLIFASFITSRYWMDFLIFFIFVYVSNFQLARNYIASSNNFFEKDQNSWKFLLKMSQHVYSGPEHELGYFLYMPDALSYQTKYSVSYAAKNSNKTVFYFQKKPVTYLVIAPPPPDKIGMEDWWWRKNQVHITTTAQSVVSYPNGYKIERYLLDATQRNIPFDQAIDTGIHFR